ncbi:unnamed protein product [Rhizoctonia solani]|uniref:J domain-containing protein n=1 Tax=Rhizoctonia solani TaxID=456999 RepID=A0A8H3DIF1_9AGAM|nr:unnamed protein product [Rhizoctonia solani]
MASHLYETLNLGMKATPDEIRKAYKKLALKTHPDRAPPERKQEAEEEFRKVNAAYEVLIDEEKRRIYDRHGVYPPPEPNSPENTYSNPFSHQPPPPRYQPPPTFSRPSFERHSRRSAPRPTDAFGQMFNETPFPATAPPGSGPFGMHHPSQFTDPFKIFHDVFATAMPPHHIPNMRFQPMIPIVGGHDLFLGSDRIQPFRSTDPNIMWTEETRTTKIINGHHQTIHTVVDKDGNVHRSYDIDGKHWETFNNEIVQPYEAIYDTHHERIDYAPPPPSHGRSRKSSTGRKSRHGSPGYPYVSATPQPTVPPSHHVRTKSQHIPTRHAYRRMYSYSEEDLGSPVNDTENVRPYSYDFAPAATPRYEEYHYPAAASEHRSKRHYEHAAPPAPSRDPESAHRRAVRPDEPYQSMYADREPHSFVHPNPEHEVKEKKWWHRFKG